MMKKTRTVRKTKVIDGVICSVRGVPLTRASNTMTEAQFFSWLLSGARRLTIKWRPRNDKLNEGRREYTGPDRRTKWEYSCETCSGWFKRKEIELDHIETLGGMSCFEDIEGWYRKAFVEKDGFRRLCKACHLAVTHSEENKDAKRRKKILQKLVDREQDLDLGY